MDYITGEIVCSATGKEKVDRVARIHDYLVREYNEATNSYEANAVGIAFAQCLDNMNTPKQSPRRNPKGKIVEGLKGLYVEGKMKNDVLFPDLAFAIAKRQIVCHDREFLQQAKLVARDNDKPVTDKVNGKHTHLPFDWVMMVAGLVQLSKYAPRMPLKAKTFYL